MKKNIYPIVILSIFFSSMNIESSLKFSPLKSSPELFKSIESSFGLLERDKIEAKSLFARKNNSNIEFTTEELESKKNNLEKSIDFAKKNIAPFLKDYDALISINKYLIDFYNENIQESEEILKFLTQIHSAVN